MLFGAAVIPPVLNLLNQAYGFAGAPGAHAAASALPAPQATLISALAKGVIQGQIDWGLIGIGVLVGLVLIAVDETLRRTKGYGLPPLATGIGIYLPAATTLTVMVGALVGWRYERWAASSRNPEAAKRMGVLLASGLIVGESLFGVLLAGIIVASHRDDPLGLVGDAFAGAAKLLGTVAFIAVVAALYRWTARISQRGA